MNINKICVIGAGQMGTGIAQVCALAGIDVALNDISEERIAAVQKFSEVYAAHIPDMAAVVTEEMGSPITFSNLAQSPAPWMMLNTFLQIAAEYPWEERRQGGEHDQAQRWSPSKLAGTSSYPSLSPSSRQKTRNEVRRVPDQNRCRR